MHVPVVVEHTLQLSEHIKDVNAKRFGYEPAVAPPRVTAVPRQLLAYFAASVRGKTFDRSRIQAKFVMGSENGVGGRYGPPTRTAS